jgi:hypothetical protein
MSDKDGNRTTTSEVEAEDMHDGEDYDCPSYTLHNVRSDEAFEYVDNKASAAKNGKIMEAIPNERRLKDSISAKSSNYATKSVQPVKKARSAFLFFQGEQLSLIRSDLGAGGSMGEAMTEVSARFQSYHFHGNQKSNWIFLLLL